MKTDTYTKVILTIIAACLTVNVIGEFDWVSKAYASDETKNNANLNALPAETIDVRIVDINTYDELNVNLKSVDTYDEVKVNLKSIDTSDELDINIDEVGGSSVYTGNAIPVTIKN